MLVLKRNLLVALILLLSTLFLAAGCSKKPVQIETRPTGGGMKVIPADNAGENK